MAEMAGNYLLLRQPPETPYFYTPLSSDRNEIRLLRICAQSPEVDGLVNCTMNHASMDLDPSYDALSYTWSDKDGVSECSRAIRIDGQTLPVTTNLEAALRKLLLTATATYGLWVDAICINQADRVERNEQVRNMKLIYERSKEVIVWLGEEYENSADAFGLLKSIVQVGLQESLCHGPWNKTLGLPKDALSRLSAVTRLFERDYWQRAWTYQELAVATNVVVHCGPDSITWEDLKGAQATLKEQFDWIVELFSATDIGTVFPHRLILRGPQLMDRLGANWEGASLASLLLLLQVRGKRAKDPRDLVYSMVGLLTQDDRERFPVDYGLPVREVFINAAKFMIFEDNDLSILAGNKPPRSLDPTLGDRHLPSWVPNYTTTSATNQFRIDWIGHFAGASGTIAHNCVLLEPEVLSVEGVRIGTVTQVGPQMPPYASDAVTFPPVFEAFYDWWCMFHSVRGKHLVGAEGFFDFVWFGQDPKLQTRWNAHNLVDMRIVMDIYRPSDTTLTEILPESQGPVDASRRQRAELNTAAAATMCVDRKFFIADGKVCGLGPQCVEVGDLVVVVLGVKVPLILRARSEGEGGYYNIGDTYITGFMNGEAVESKGDGKFDREEYRLY